MTSLKYTEENKVFWYLHLTEEQQKAYDVLHKKLSASNALVAGADDKWTLLRFLKARQYDPDKAMLMYVNMAKWRVEHDVEMLYKTLEYPELDNVVPYLTHFYHKVCDAWAMQVVCSTLLCQCTTILMCRWIALAGLCT
jgi:hypothetical protein